MECLGFSGLVPAGSALEDAGEAAPVMAPFRFGFDTTESEGYGLEADVIGTGTTPTHPVRASLVEGYPPGVISCATPFLELEPEIVAATAAALGRGHSSAIPAGWRREEGDEGDGSPCPAESELELALRAHEHAGVAGSPEAGPALALHDAGVCRTLIPGLSAASPAPRYPGGKVSQQGQQRRQQRATATATAAGTGGAGLTAAALARKQARRTSNRRPAAIQGLAAVTVSNKTALDAHWPSEVLDMATRDLNAWLKENPLGAAQQKELKRARRRKKNRVYAKTSRLKRLSEQASLHETRENLHDANQRLRAELGVMRGEVGRLQERCTFLSALLQATPAVRPSGRAGQLLAAAIAAVQ